LTDAAARGGVNLPDRRAIDYEIRRIVAYGAVSDVEACHAALRRWLARHATKTLPH
jgi:DTW domain-containing protein YfiP